MAAAFWQRPSAGLGIMSSVMILVFVSLTMSRWIPMRCVPCGVRYDSAPGLSRAPSRRAAHPGFTAISCGTHPAQHGSPCTCFVQPAVSGGGMLRSEVDGRGKRSKRGSGSRPLRGSKSCLCCSSPETLLRPSLPCSCACQNRRHTKGRRLSYSKSVPPRAGPATHGRGCGWCCGHLQHVGHRGGHAGVFPECD
jgi:hypothetical protein